MAFAMVSVSLHVPFGRGEASQRRSYLAQSVCAFLLLSDRAAADTSGLVCASLAASSADSMHCRHTYHRSRDPVLDFLSAAAQVRRGLLRPVSGNADPSDRQLHVLQPADDGPMPGGIR